LNLFAATPDRATSLERAGLLSSRASDDLPECERYDQALDYHAQSLAAQLSPSLRAGCCLRALRWLSDAIDGPAPSIAEMMSYARVAR